MVQPQTQRAPLIDRYGRTHTYLRVSLTDRCNLRCAYCMPSLAMVWKDRSELLTFEEIERTVRIFAEMGVTKVRLTGGEPTVRRGLPKLAENLSKIPGIQELAITTNGLLLVELAKPLADAGIQVINISIDSLRRERYREIARMDQLERALAGLGAALSAGFREVKLNVVVMAGVNDDELLDFVELARDWPLNVRFIEFMPFDDNGWNRASLFPYARMRSRIEAKHPLMPIAREASAVAKDFAIEGFRGTVSFVTSMTESFCSGCNRLRLTAEGKVKPCLFLPAEVDIRDAMRNDAEDAEIESLIRLALDKKWEAHPPMDELVRLKNRRMIDIGG